VFFCARRRLAHDPVLRDRETRGVTASNSRYFCSAKQITTWKDRPVFEWPEGLPAVLFSVIDPSGGAKDGGSEWAICTMALCSGRPVVSCALQCMLVHMRIAFGLHLDEGGGVRVDQALGSFFGRERLTVAITTGDEVSEIASEDVVDVRDVLRVETK
jgi:hypothetical protein